MAVVYWIHAPHHVDIFTEGYVGVTVRTAEQRFSAHKCKAHSGVILPISSAIRKYGDSIKVDVVLEGEESYCYLIEGKLRSRPFIGWNSAVGGEVSPTTGTKASEETRKKQSAARSGVKNPNYKKPLPDWHKKRLSEFRTGKLLSNEVKAKISGSVKLFLNGRAHKPLWLKADFLYQVWKKNGCCGPDKLHRLIDRLFTISQLGNIVKQFKKGWVPLEDSEWLTFKEQQEVLNGN